MFFTRHAIAKLRERSCLQPWEVKQYLGEDKMIAVGRDGNRVHYVFFSHADNQHFAMILDEKTQDVITFLPLDYHLNLAWAVSDEVLAQTRAMPAPVPTPPKNVDNDPYVFKVGAYIRLRGRVFPANMGIWNIKDLPENIEDLKHNKSFVNIVRGRIKEKLRLAGPDARFVSLFVRMMGETKPLPWTID